MNIPLVLNHIQPAMKAGGLAHYNRDWKPSHPHNRHHKHKSSASQVALINIRDSKQWHIWAEFKICT